MIRLDHEARPAFGFCAPLYPLIRASKRNGWRRRACFRLDFVTFLKSSRLCIDRSINFWKCPVEQPFILYQSLDISKKLTCINLKTIIIRIRFLPNESNQEEDFLTSNIRWKYTNLCMTYRTLPIILCLIYDSTTANCESPCFEKKLVISTSPAHYRCFEDVWIIFDCSLNEQRGVGQRFNLVTSTKYSDLSKIN